MAINPKLLNEGESVVLSTRTHPKVLLVPLIALVVILAVAVFLNTLGSGDAAGIMHLVVWILAALAIFWFVVRPVVRWATTTYTFTNRRFMKRSGFIAKEGRTIPLNRISGVDFEIGVIDRLFGCGTLVVTDASGGIVSDAQVTLVNVDTGVSQTAKTNSTGSYSFPSLPPGKYKITVSAKGFASLTQENVTLGGAETRTISLALKVGEVTETVVVTTDPAPVQSSEAKVTANISTTEIRNLPMAGRNVLDLVALAPGVTGVGNLSGQAGSERCQRASEPDVCRVGDAVHDGAPFDESEGNSVPAQRPVMPTSPAQSPSHQP